MGYSCSLLATLIFSHVYLQLSFPILHGRVNVETKPVDSRRTRNNDRIPLNSPWFEIFYFTYPNLTQVNAHMKFLT